MELIESRSDIAYQLLISTVESLADVAFGDYEPDQSEKIATKLAVQQRARDFGLDEEQAKQLALDVCKGERWLRRKFKKFILDFVSLDELAVKDRVFLVHESFYPPKKDILKALGRIYDARSTNLHVATPFPRHVGVGTSTSIKISQLPAFSQPLDIPPVPWFERVVSLAAQKFLIEKSGIAVAPFLSE